MNNTGVILQSCKELDKKDNPIITFCNCGQIAVIKIKSSFYNFGICQNCINNHTQGNSI